MLGFGAAVGKPDSILIYFSYFFWIANQNIATIDWGVVGRSQKLRKIRMTECELGNIEDINS